MAVSSHGPYVYVLQSGRNGRFYIGYTSNLDARLFAHNTGRVKATRHQRPWALVYTEPCTDATTARRREWQLKRLKSRSAIEALIQTGWLERPDEIGEVTGSSPVPPTIANGNDEDE